MNNQAMALRVKNVTVTVPDSASAGDMLPIFVDGAVYQAAVPPELKPGDTFVASVPVYEGRPNRVAPLDVEEISGARQYSVSGDGPWQGQLSACVGILLNVTLLILTLMLLSNVSWSFELAAGESGQTCYWARCDCWGWSWATCSTCWTCAQRLWTWPIGQDALPYKGSGCTSAAAEAGADGSGSGANGTLGIGSGANYHTNGTLGTQWAPEEDTQCDWGDSGDGVPDYWSLVVAVACNIPACLAALLCKAPASCRRGGHKGLMGGCVGFAFLLRLATIGAMGAQLFEYYDETVLYNFFVAPFPYVYVTSTSILGYWQSDKYMAGYGRTVLATFVVTVMTAGFDLLYVVLSAVSPKWSGTRDGSDLDEPSGSWWRDSYDYAWC